MEWLLTTLIAAGLASAGILAFRKRKVTAHTDSWRSKVEERDLGNLHAGDVLLHEGKDLIIASVACFSQGRARWQECCFDERHGEQWMAVRPDDPEHVLLGRRVRELSLGQKPPGSLEHEDKIYRLGKRGEAQVELKGAPPEDLAAGRCRYWRYSRPGVDCLWIYRGGERQLIIAGQRVKRHMVTLIPGPD